MKRRTLLATALAGGFAVPAKADAPTLLPVLTYHRFDPLQSHSGTIVTTPVFAQQMAWLADNHVRVAPLRESVAVAKGQPLAGPTVVLTADDGWRSVYTEMFPILQRHRFLATLFINPPMIGRGGAYLTWPMIAEMVKSGLVDVQAHTRNHPNFNTERARRDAAGYQAFITQQIAGSRADITEHLGLPADMLAWPFGIHDPTLEHEAEAAGYIAAFALGSRAVASGDPLYALPRYQVYDTDTPARFAFVAGGHPRVLAHPKAPS